MKTGENIEKKRIIAHLDMDAFFASVEERDNPKIKGLPIAVGSNPLEGHGRGVVSTANYKAREYGIRSALPISVAWRLSEKAREEGKPEVVFLDVDFSKYSRASEEIMKIVRKYSAITEQASVDEIYIDLSFLKLSFRKAEDICRKIKKEIWEKEKLTASIGLGKNKLVAKIASDMQKPDGLTVIAPEKTEEFLEPLSIRKIPGIGPKTEQRLNNSKIRTIKDLKNISQEELEEMLGKWGLDLFEKARGNDNDPVSEDYEIKSIGEQTTFQNDSLDFKFIIEQLDGLCEGVFRSFQKSEFKTFRTITATIRLSDFETKNRSHTLPPHHFLSQAYNKIKNQGEVISRKSININKKNNGKWCGGMPKPQETLKTLKVESIKLLMPFFDSRENPKKRKIRLIGIRIEKLK